MKLTLLMAAIVATLIYVPLGVLLALAAYVVLGVPLHAFVTFGGAANTLFGLLAWWAVAFVPAFAYAGIVIADGR